MFIKMEDLYKTLQLSIYIIGTVHLWMGYYEITTMFMIFQSHDDNAEDDGYLHPHLIILN